MAADFWAGYISGAAGILVGNPLDLIKTRQQAVPTAAADPVRATSVASLRATFDQAGTLVRGATAPVLGYGALNALLFVTYNRTLALLTPDPQAAPGYGPMFLAGVLGGLATFAVSAPTELLKVRAQAATSPPSVASPPRTPTTPTTAMEAGTGPGTGGAGRRRGGGGGAGPGLGSTWSQARALLRAEGPRGFFLGGGVTAARDAIGYGFYFVAYEAMRRELFGAAATPADRNHGPVDVPGGGIPVPELAAWKVLACGGVAGVISWAVVFPLDVVKTRVQAQPVLEVPAAAQAGAAAVAATTATRTGAAAVVGERAPLLLHPDHAKTLVTAAVQRVRPASSSSSASASSSSSLRSASSSTSTTPSSLSFPAPAGAAMTATPARQSTWAVTAAAYREGGIAVFFRGLGVCSVRAFVVNAVQWAVYEWIVALLVRADAPTKR